MAPPPPSPSLRFSPLKDGGGDVHKRARSLESACGATPQLFKDHEDDLALFNEMHSKETHNFLLHSSSDDFDHTFSSNLRNLSDIKMGAARGDSCSDLLNADADKNDYDWLLTPPDTPLFPSLDDEPAPPDVPSRGRPRSQPITISRSSSMEKSLRSSRGSPSPNRSSPSPRSGSGTFQSRGRPSSAPLSGPTSSQRSSTPSRKPYPSPTNASMHAPRSSTPTPRSMSTVSGTRGSSPIRTNRGNSVSPKIMAWQSNIPGFSTEAPPNLRTSLADRPASYVRGSSPASRSSRDSSSKFGRQSMSPTAPRSFSSSHSQDRDRTSPQSKGSVASSGDEDVDSLQSIHVGSLDRIVSNRSGAQLNSRALTFSRKSGKIFSPSSAPKRSFDSALRQTDHHKSPQNMFRPLLSSVPSSSFYVGKTSSAHRALISRNSWVTTSSNASSSGAPDTEGSDHHQEDVAIESGKVPYSDGQDDIFSFDKVDGLDKALHDADVGSHHLQLGGFDGDTTVECVPSDSEEFSQDAEVEICSSSDTLCFMTDFSRAECSENMQVCSKCGCQYHVTEAIEKDISLCPDCSSQDFLVVTNIQDTYTENSRILAAKTSEEFRTFNDPVDPVSALEQQPQLIDVGTMVVLHGDHENQSQTSHYEIHDEQSFTDSQESSHPQSVMDGGEESTIRPQDTGLSTVDCMRSESDSAAQQSLPSNSFPGMKVDVSEGTGISILLKRSTSGRGPIVQSRNFIASTITYDDISYARDSLNSFRSSIGHGSTSASSSVDCSSARQAEARVQRQMSGRKSDAESYRYDVNTRPPSAGSSTSGTSNRAHVAFGLMTCTNNKENVEVFNSDAEHGGVEEIFVTSEGKQVGDATGFEEAIIERNENSRTLDASAPDFSRQTIVIQLDDNSAAEASSNENFTLHENEDDHSHPLRNTLETSAADIHPEPSFETECPIVNACLDVPDTPTHSRLASISEIETENHVESFADLDKNHVSTDSSCTVIEFQEASVPTTPYNKDVVVSYMDHNNMYGMSVESAVMVECEGGGKARSLSPEEATDTILFCRSIVHDLAYQAATIAIDKESSSISWEVSSPGVTVLGKSNFDRKETGGRSSGKRAVKSKKFKQKQMETTDADPSPGKTENDENANVPTVRNVGLPNKMDSTKPPKLESKCNCAIM